MTRIPSIHPEPVAESVAAPPPTMDATVIFQREFRYVWSTLRRLGVQPRDLEDMTHEVFLRVHSQLALYDPARPLRPWLFGLSLGLASNYRRLARHRASSEHDVANLADSNGNAEEAMERRETFQLVHSALQKVPLEQRAVLVLHELDGFPVPEIATTLGLGLNTAYSRLRLGREAFRKAVQRQARKAGFR